MGHFNSALPSTVHRTLRALKAKLGADLESTLNQTSTNQAIGYSTAKLFCDVFENLTGQNAGFGGP